MLHLPGFGAARPVDVPFLIGASGPKGLELARRLGDGRVLRRPCRSSATRRGTPCSASAP